MAQFDSVYWSNVSDKFLIVEKAQVTSVVNKEGSELYKESTSTWS